MELRQLRIFEAAVRLRSLTRVAIALELTPATVSRDLFTLESEMGGRLFQRTGRGVMLTELGAVVAGEILDMVMRADRLPMFSRGAGGAVSGDVRLGATPSAARLVAPALFVQLRRRHPGIRLQVVEGFSGVLEDELAAGRLDLAVLQRMSGIAGPRDTLLTTSQLYLISAPGATQQGAGAASLEQILLLPLALPKLPHMVRSMLDGFARRGGLSLDVRFTADSLAVLLEVVGTGECHTVLPFYAAAPVVKSGLVISRVITDPTVEINVVLRSSSDCSGTPATREVEREILLVVDRIFGTPPCELQVPAATTGS